MHKNIRLLSLVIIITFASLIPGQVVFAETDRDAFVEDLFKNDSENKKLTNEQNQQTDEQNIEKNLNIESDSDVGVSLGDFARMILALIIVIGLLYFTLKFVNRRSRSYQSSQLVENLGGTSLGTNRSVQVVKVGKRILIVGVGENVKLLTEINNNPEVEAMIADYNDRVDQFVQPNNIFSKLFNKINRSNSEPDEHIDEFETMLRNEFKEIRNERTSFYKELERKGQTGDE